MAAQGRFAFAAVALAAAGAVRAEPTAFGITDLAARLVEPALAQVQDAAVRRMAGPLSEEASRVFRARSAHWAPVIRGQYGIRDDDRTRRGQIRLAPLLEDDVGRSRAWAVVATWDLTQVIYARDEGQLALSHVHLARVRQEAADDAVRLYEERWRLRSALRFAPDGVSRARVDMLLALLRTTAELDALTGGLYGAQLAQAQDQVAALEPQLQPGSVAAPTAEPPALARKQARSLSGASDRPVAPTSSGASSIEAVGPPAPRVIAPAPLAEEEE